MKYGTQCKYLTVHVVEGSGPSLLGRDWLKEVKLDWRSIGVASIDKGRSQVAELLSKYSSVFEEGLSVMNTFKARLHLKPGCKPKFCKARSVQFALKPAVEAELSHFMKEGVLQQVKHSHWAVPVIPVPKNDGHLRLCGDYKVSVNPAMEID